MLQKCFVLNLKTFIVYVPACIWVDVMQVWRSEDNLKEWILSFYPVGPGDWIQFIRLDSKSTYLLSRLSGSLSEIYTVFLLSVVALLHILYVYLDF